MTPFLIKQGDTLPALEVTLYEIDGSAVDLTTAVSAELVLRDRSGVEQWRAAATLLTPPTAGGVKYQWADGDTDTVGDFVAEFEVTFAAGLRTFPTVGAYPVVVLDSTKPSRTPGATVELFLPSPKVIDYGLLTATPTEHATAVRMRRGTTAEHAVFAGRDAELTMDTTRKVPVVHYGSRLGGFPVDYSHQVARFGAKGDGDTDDSAAIAAAIAALTTTGRHCVLEFEPKLYNLGNAAVAINLNKSVRLKGNGARFKYGGTGAAIEVNAFDIGIEDLDIYSSNAAYTAGVYTGAINVQVGIGVSFKSKGQYFRLLNVGAEGFAIGYKFLGSAEGCSYGDVQNPRLINNTVDMLFRAEATANSFVTAIRVFGGTMTKGPYADMTGSRDIVGEDPGSPGTARLDGIVVNGTICEGRPEKNLLWDGNRSAFNNMYWDYGLSSNNIEFTAKSSYNMVLGGSALDAISVLDNGTGNMIWDTKRFLTFGGLLDLSGNAPNPNLWGKGRIRFPLDGNPVDHPNVLDYYQEGSLIPYIFGAPQADPAPTITYADNADREAGLNGKFTRIGNVMYFWMTVAWTDVDGSTGALVLAGLPFAAHAALGDAQVVNVAANGLTFSGNLVAIMRSGLGELAFYSQTSGGNLAAVDIPNAGALNVSGSYMVN